MEGQSNRTRRVLAYVIDFTLLYLPCILSTNILKLSFLGRFSVFAVLIAVVSFFVVFILRDYLFHGRSIGKRLFGLRVVDANTRLEPTAKQLIVKNIFLFFYPIDGLFLIASGKSLGERATGTIVLREQQLPSEDSPSASEQAVSQEKEPPAKKRIAVAAKVVLCISIPMFLIISFALDIVKKQDNYQIAYAYLVDSDSYTETQADESQIALTAYSFNSKLDSNGDSVSTDVTFTFLVRGQQYQVVCHQDGDMWYVCNDCTDFQ